MLQKILVFLLAAAPAAIACSAAATAESSTTRIEPRPFYGATVSIEEGVRVIRPLPPERHVIINPDHKTPLSLGFNDTRVYERRSIRNYNFNSDDAAGDGVYNRYGYGGAFANSYRPRLHWGQSHRPKGGGGYAP